MKDILIAHSEKTELEDIKKDIIKQLGDTKPAMIIYFASSNFDQERLAHELSETFSSTAIIGCSTAGEIISGKMLKNSVVLMSFSENYISDIKIKTIHEIKGKNTDEIKKKIKAEFKDFETHFKENLMDMDFEKYVGIVLIDGLTCAEEKIMDVIGDLTNVIFIGASAGDDLKFKETYIYANGHACTNSAVFALIKPAGEFDIIKTQSFCSMKKILTATKVDEETRTVAEFNDKPAAIAYADALNVKAEEANKYFMSNPIGLMIDNEPYIRSPQQINEGKMVFYCNVINGMELELMDSTNIIEDTKNAVSEKIKKLGHISGIINFNCILRTLELEEKGLTEDYGNIFKDVPTIGFSTYGEEYLGHINQTSTMLVFK